LPTGEGEKNKVKICIDEGNGTEETNAKLALVHPDFSLLSFERVPTWDKNKAYLASLEGAYSTPLAIYCEELGGDLFIKSEMERASDSLRHFGIDLTDDAVSADYLIRSTTSNGQPCYLLTRWPNPVEGEPLKEGGIPVSKPVLGQNQHSVNEIVRQLKHIQRWRQLLELKNPAQEGLPFEVKFTKITETGSEMGAIKVQNEAMELLYEKDSKGEFTGFFRIEIRNNSPVSYHVALLYLSQDFLIHPNIIEQGVVDLQPGTNIFPFGGKFKMKYEPYIGEFKLRYSACWFKLVYSKEKFSVHSLAQAGLLDETERDKTRANIELEMKELSHADKAEWGTATYMIKMRKPDES
jgi:hypothetical protein